MGEGERENEGRNFPSFSSQMEENILTQNRERDAARRVCGSLCWAPPDDESNHDVRQGSSGQGKMSALPRHTESTLYSMYSAKR